jgi:DNA-binding HxlR family transcriptional regulator
MAKSALSRGEARAQFKDALESDDLRLLDMPSILFHRARVLLMNILYKFGPVDFRDMKNDLKLTAGNLASHLRALKEAGYIQENKEIIGTRPRTSYQLTEKGVRTFRDFKRSILEVLGDE